MKARVLVIAGAPAIHLNEHDTGARRPSSEAGINIGHTEGARLHEIAEKLRARAGAAG